MKKTIIALMALAGVACAAYEENLLWSMEIVDNSYKFTTGAAYGDGTYTGETKWGSQDFTTMPGYVYSDGTKKVSIESATGVKFGDSFTLSMDCSLTGAVTPPAEGQTAVETIHLVQLCETASWQYNVTFNTLTGQLGMSGASGMSNVTAYGTYTLADITNITLTMDGDVNEDGIVTVYVNNQKALQATMSGTNRHNTSNINAGFVFLNDRSYQTAGAVGGVSGVRLYNAVIPVPEPTTATLSLLALAGLAARRRRK